MTLGEAKMDEEWEEQMIRQITEMFKNMGMPMDAETLRGMIGNFRTQFEQMGIDPEKLSGDSVNLNIDLSQFKEMLSGSGDIKDMFEKMGVKVEVDAKAIKVDTPEGEESSITFPPADFYLDGWMMNVTIDCSMQIDLTENNIEVSLINDGEVIEIMRTTQVNPVTKIDLPQPCEDLVDWEFNNGILDLTLKLIPQGSALAEPDDGDDDDRPDKAEDDDEEEEMPDVSIDFGDEDDDEDDGGIPIV
jgi:hypothetical protein